MRPSDAARIRQVVRRVQVEHPREFVDPDNQFRLEPDGLANYFLQHYVAALDQDAKAVSPCERLCCGLLVLLGPKHPDDGVTDKTNASDELRAEFAVQLCKIVRGLPLLPELVRLCGESSRVKPLLQGTANQRDTPRNHADVLSTPTGDAANEETSGLCDLGQQEVAQVLAVLDDLQRLAISNLTHLAIAFGGGWRRTPLKAAPIDPDPYALTVAHKNAPNAAIRC